MNLPLSEIQADIKTRLLAHAWFAPLPIFLENDPLGTAEDDKKQPDLEEAALEEKGIVIKLISPALRVGDETKEAIQFGSHTGVVLVENPAINRAPTGLRKAVVDFPEMLARALKPAGYTIPVQDVINSSADDDLSTYLVVVRSRRLIDTE